jgi:exodeoxyribonuclease V gamma subunit
MPTASARFHLIYGNRLDRLAAHLGARLTTPAAADTLSADVVLIPQPALRHWLQQALAERYGIAANLDLCTPSEFVWRLLRAARPELPDASPWDRERLRWQLFALLGDNAATLPPPVRRHLQRAANDDLGDGERASNGNAMARYALADALAAAYDRYQAYRPDWLRDWERNVPASRDDWQAQLWRSLRQRLKGSPHRAALLDEWLTRHDREAEGYAGIVPPGLPPPGLPPRVAAFGTIHVSPDVLHMLAVVGQWIELDFYLPMPSAEYWGDVESLRERVRRDGIKSLSAALADAERDNPLLTAWGAGGREIVAQLFSYDVVLPQRETELFVAPGRDTLLHRLQQDVLERAAPTVATFDAGDVSLQLHACHSKLREVEVLHDQLRALLDDPRFDPPLQPRDIAVLAPDIADYLPLARAVFGGLAPDDPRYIPFALADRPQAQSHPLVAMLLDVLALADAPLTASGFRDLLATPAVAHALQLDAAQRARIDGWFAAAGIRWGDDEHARERAGAGRWREYSFDFGIDRLLSGYAAGDAADASVAGTELIAPYSELEGADAETLDRALAFYRRLRELAAWMRESHPAAEWRARLAGWLQASLAPVPQDDAETQARRLLLETLDDFASEAANAGALPALLVRRALRDALTLPSPHRPWLSGGVTFAGMVPLRTVPFRAICLLGLDADAYPRREPADDINRLVDAIQGRAPRYPGDRSVRDDDRFLFLQLLCAAGDVFYLSYGGSDARDGSVREPSPVIAELLDAVERMHGEPVREQLYVQHPLQPFSPRAFGAGDDGGVEPRRFSYRKEWAMPAAAAVQSAESPFLTAPLAMDAFEFELPDRNALQAFFANPAKAWLQDRLGLRLITREETLDDREPQGRDALRRYAVIAALTADDPQQNDDQGDDQNHDIVRRMRARAELPPGRDGDALIEDTRPLARGLLAEARVVLTASTPREVAEATAPVAFRFDDVHRDADGHPLRLILEAGKLEGKRRLRAGIDHLLLASVHGAAARTVLVGEGEAKSGRKKTGDAADDAPPIAIQTFAGIDRDTALARLDVLLALWRRGQSEPLPFAPKAGWAYVEKFHAEHSRSSRPPDHAAAWTAAQQAFTPGFGDYRGESADAWLALVFRPQGLFDAVDSARARDFGATARAIFDALETQA